MRRTAAALFLALGFAWALGAEALPPQAEALRPAIQKAEQRLQGASLQLQAARHDAEPVQASVDQLRPLADSWWGAWRLKRRLGDLKLRLDAVEAARAAQAEAHQNLVLLLTGADEELSSAFEASLARTKNNGLNAVWAGWWRQKRAWQERLMALQPVAGTAPPASTGAQPKILREALQIQAQRERALLDALGRRKALSAQEWADERARLKLTFKSPAAGGI